MKDWNDLRYFLAVAREHTLAGAARALGVTHSTMFRRIQGMEERLGTRLFERLATGYALTLAGREMAGIAEHVEQQINALARTLDGADGRMAGSLRITTTDTLSYGLLGPHLQRFQRRYPEIQLDLAVQNRFLSLANREADVAIRPAASVREGEVVGRQLSEIAAAVYASRAYLRAHGRPATLADLKSHAVITGDDSLRHTVTSRWMALQVPSGNAVYQSNSLLDQLRAVQAGLGVAAMPCFLADRDRHLVRLFPPEPRMTNKLWLLVHRDLRRNARVRAFSDFMASSIGADRDLLEGRSGATLSPGVRKRARARRAPHDAPQ